MKISYITKHDAFDIEAWSGTDFYIAKALKEQNAEMNYIGNLFSPPDLYSKAKRAIYRSFGKKYLFDRQPAVARQYARKIKALLPPNIDIVFSPGSIPISLLDTKHPKVIYSDATFAGMIDFYEAFSNLSKASIAQGNYCEQKALESCQLAIFSSDWAARTAIEHYKVNASKIKVVAFGANIEANREQEDIKVLLKARSTTACNLLFLGVDWYRKGGDFALSVAEELNALGVPTRLHIVGMRQLPLRQLPSFAVDHGFISKRTTAGRAQLDKLFMECDFLLLPTKADCSPVVFCEASSFGLPSIAPAVGGIPTIIRDDINGKTFPVSANAQEYAGYLASLFRDRTRYEELCYSSFNEYRQRLNWKAAGSSIMGLLKEL